MVVAKTKKNEEELTELTCEHCGIPIEPDEWSDRKVAEVLKRWTGRDVITVCRHCGVTRRIDIEGCHNCGG